MKTKLPDAEIDSIIRLRYGRLPKSRFDTAYVSYDRLARIWKISGSQIRVLVLRRLDELSGSTLADVVPEPRNRKRYGIQFVSEEMELVMPILL